jgi:hypothetical protein
MAGYTLGFDDGGSVDDQDTPTIPPIEDASADAGQGQSPESSPAPQQQSYGPLAGADFNPTHVPGNVKRIAAYLMGADAAPPPVAKKFEQGVKQENPGVSDDDANLLAVHKASELGGPAAAWQMVQYNRMAYNAKQSFAKAALNGIDGKAGNAQAAAQAATQAGAHILDGSSTIFTAMPDGSGFTAAVKMPGTNRSVTFQLNPQQMNQWLDTGGHGQWDRVMEDGTPQSLQKLSSQQQADQDQDDAQDAAPAAAAAPQAKAKGTPPSTSPTETAINMANEDNQDSDPEAPEANPNAGQPTNIGKTPSSLNLGEETQPSTLPPKPHSYGNDLESASQARFPSVSQEGQRQDWMAQQQNQRSERIAKTGQAAMGAQARQNVAATAAGARVDATTIASGTKEKGVEYAADKKADSAGNVATINANAKTQGYAQRAAAAALKQASTNNNAAQNEANKNFRAEIAAKGMTMSDDAVNKLAAKYGIHLPGVAAPQAQAPQAQAPTGQAPAAQTSAAVPPAAQRQPGFTTTTAKGTFKWNGSGWDKQ